MTVLKRASKKDIPLLQDICRTAYSQHFGDHWQEGGLDIYLEEQFGTNRLEKELVGDESQFYFIQYEGKTVGFCKIRFNAHFEKEPNLPACELEKIYLLKEWVGMKIGQKALFELLEIAKSYNSEIIFLCVVDSNAKAIPFYESQGFVIYKRTRLEIPLFKDHLRGMLVMCKYLVESIK